MRIVISLIIPGDFGRECWMTTTDQDGNCSLR